MRLVEQNVGVALSLASIAHILRNGIIALTGPSRDLVDNPDVVRSYLGGVAHPRRPPESFPARSPTRV